MEITRVEAVSDRPNSFVQPRGLSPYRPVTGQRPVIESQLLGSGVNPTLVRHCPLRRREVLGAVVADLVFRRLQAAPIGGGFDPTRIDREEVVADAALAGLREQALNDHFRLFVCALAEVGVAGVA